MIPGRRPSWPRRPAARPPRKGENRPSPSIVIATFLGGGSDWTDTDTGEVGKPPMSVGMIEYPDGGGELYSVRTRRRGTAAPGFDIVQEVR